MLRRGFKDPTRSGDRVVHSVHMRPPGQGRTEGHVWVYGCFFQARLHTPWSRVAGWAWGARVFLGTCGVGAPLLGGGLAGPFGLVMSVLVSCRCSAAPVSVSVLVLGGGGAGFAVEAYLWGVAP